jgi:hypothetical protein
MVSKHNKDWHTQLNCVLWDYSTSIRKSIGNTPYKLIYASKAIIPL